MINNVLRNFKTQYKRAGIKPVGVLTVHTLRKCAGQNWADKLPMNVVKELMGHSDIATTQKYYNQVDEDREPPHHFCKPWQAVPIHKRRFFNLFTTKFHFTIQYQQVSYQQVSQS